MIDILLHLFIPNDIDIVTERFDDIDEALELIVVRCKELEVFHEQEV